MNISSLKILYLTNLPAPYRFPIWDRIAKTASLKVVFLLKEKNWRGWPAPPDGTAWKYDFLSSNSIKIQDFEFIPNVFGVNRILKGIEVAIIGSWEAPIYIRTIMTAQRRGIPVIQIYESTNQSQRFKDGPIASIRAYLMRRASLVVAFGKDSAEAAFDMGVPKSRIIELFNPVDVTWFNVNAELYRDPISLGHRYLYVGQLIQRKNVFALIDAFAKIRRDSDILTIVGDGKLFLDLLAYTKSLKLSDSIHYVSNVDRNELIKIYASNHTLILPSTNEVWGLVVNEALASGMHIVCSNRCGVASFVNKMQGSFVCNPEIDSIAEAMLKSRSNWNGYILKPEILDFTPENFADRLLSAISELQ